MSGRIGRFYLLVSSVIWFIIIFIIFRRSVNGMICLICWGWRRKMMMWKLIGILI